VFTDFRQAIYIDRHRPTSQIVSFVPIVPGVNENRRLTVQTDSTVNEVHVFFDLPAGLTDAQVLSMVNNTNRANQIDRNLFTYDLHGLTSGNHVATVVTFEISGNSDVQRFPGLYTSTIFGAGLGDLDFNGRIDASDVNLFGQVLGSDNGQFNPAADMNGDGLIDNSDLLRYYAILQNSGADASTFAAYNQLLGPPLAGFSIYPGDQLTLHANQPTTTSPLLWFTWDINGQGRFDIGGARAAVTWDALAGYGVTGPGAYPITSQVTDGTNTADFSTTLIVRNLPIPTAQGGAPLDGVAVFPRDFAPAMPSVTSGDAVLASNESTDEIERWGFENRRRQAVAQTEAPVDRLVADVRGAETFAPPLVPLVAVIPGDQSIPGLMSPVLLAPTACS
jgi:hypothetical protein